ncbi:MAG TPA: phage holin family protein, partial [Gemmatimonadaceae bacterium]|nr:phage holin family protein [Gemmatimonadaceae bacterium]
KLELSESTHLAGRGATWMALAFGVGIVAMVAFTILLATALGRLVGELWIGAMLAAVIELAVGIWLVLRGVHDLKEPPYTLEESREELRRTAAWVAGERAD